MVAASSPSQACFVSTYAVGIWLYIGERVAQLEDATSSHLLPYTELLSPLKGESPTFSRVWWRSLRAPAYIE